MEIEEIDLRSICRQPNRYGVTVFLVNRLGRGTGWLRLGQANLERNDRSSSPIENFWTLSARMGSRNENESVPTDFEHDTAYACKLPLIGVEFKSFRYHTATFTGWIYPSDDTASDGFHEFHVPRNGYDPRKHPKAVMCQDKDCLDAGVENGGGPHVIIPEDFFVPPFDPELYEAVKGRPVEILFYYNEE